MLAIFGVGSLGYVIVCIHVYYYCKKNKLTAFFNLLMSSCQPPPDRSHQTKAAGMMMDMPPMLMPDGMMMDMPMPMPDGMTTGYSLSSAFTLTSDLGVFECLQETMSEAGGKMSKWNCNFVPSNDEMEMCSGMEIVADTPTSFFRCTFDGPRSECHVPIQLSGRSQVVDRAVRKCNVDLQTAVEPQVYNVNLQTFTISKSGEEMYRCEMEGASDGEYRCTYLGEEEGLAKCETGTSYVVMPNNDFCTHKADGQVLCSIDNPGNMDFMDIQTFC